MTSDEKGTAMRVPPSSDGDTPSERTPEPARYVDRVTGKPATAYTPPEDRVPVLEAFTDRAAIRDSADEREPERVCCDGGHANFPPLPDDPETTPEQRAGLDEVLAKVWPDPAPGATVAALDLDALHETICDKFTGMDEVQQAADALVAEVRSLRAKVAAVEALAERLAASLALVLYDAHPIYGSTALWHGGIGGQAMTAHCAIIHGGPPGMEWTESYLPSMALHEFITATPGFNLDAAKADMLTDLRAALATGEGK